MVVHAGFAGCADDHDRTGFAAAGPDAVAPALLPQMIGRDDLQEQWLAKPSPAPRTPRR
jgi:hypothetical protein